jgi:hypothetical protein
MAASCHTGMTVTLIMLSRPVFSDVLTPGEERASVVGNTAYRELRNEVPEIRGGLNRSVQHHLI